MEERTIEKQRGRCRLRSKQLEIEVLGCCRNQCCEKYCIILLFSNSSKAKYFGKLTSGAKLCMDFFWKTEKFFVCRFSKRSIFFNITFGN